MKLGIDPEFFVFNNSNKPINAIRVLKNKKDNPLVMNGTQFYHDNVLLEFNTPPAKNFVEFYQYVNFSIHQLLTITSGYKLSLQAHAEFDQEELEFKNAKDYGCNPDYDAYTLVQNDMPSAILSKTCDRTAGGHIHIGGENDDAVCHPFLKPMFVFMLDLFVGIPSVLIDNSTESFRRRQYFGAAGSHRDKPYGLEYRVLSPFWLRSPSTMKLIYNLVEFVFESMNDGIYKKFFHFNVDKLKSNNPEKAYDCYGYDHKCVAKTINDCNSTLARKYFNFACNFMPNYLIQHVEEEIKSPRSMFIN